jgi:ATP phosphoribosyltransferase
MSGPLVLAVPSKGRLQENAHAFFARAGLDLVQPRGAREYRGTLAGLPGVEIAYLSVAEIVAQVAQGAVHLGVSGEDLVREQIADAGQRVVFIDRLGFGHANVVVAVPQAWIDVRTMADLDDVATAYRLRRDRKMRVATKYLNLTRAFFAAHNIIDYRIVESAGATEGAPAAGTAELIVDITTTGATLAANALKVLDDGVMLRSEANLIAARGAAWGDEARKAARIILDRIAAEHRARAVREVRAQVPGGAAGLAAALRERFPEVTSLPDAAGDLVTLHCPVETVHALASLLREQGADTISVARLDYVFARDNPLYAKLETGLGG